MDARVHHDALIDGVRCTTLYDSVLGIGIYSLNSAPPSPLSMQDYAHLLIFAAAGNYLAAPPNAPAAGMGTANDGKWTATVAD